MDKMTSIPKSLRAEAKLDHPCKKTCSGYSQGYQRGKDDGMQSVWDELWKVVPGLHFCTEWDFMLIHEKSKEFEACLCFPKAEREKEQK